MHLICLVWLTLSCLSCSSAKEEPPSWQTIQGRDRSLTEPLYHIRAPLSWRRVDPDPKSNLSDTTLPLLTFYIDEEEKKQIRITVHTFPYSNPKERIPPDAQVARWQRQQQLNREENAFPMQITPAAYRGFQGLFFEGKEVLAWAMKLGDPYEAFFQSHIEDLPHLAALRADYTIKATGPRSLLERHRDAIIAFARSFEWIEEMPHP